MVLGWRRQPMKPLAIDPELLGAGHWRTAFQQREKFAGIYKDTTLLSTTNSVTPFLQIFFHFGAPRA